MNTHTLSNGTTITAVKARPMTAKQMDGPDKFYAVATDANGKSIRLGTASRATSRTPEDAIERAITWLAKQEEQNR